MSVEQIPRPRSLNLDAIDQWLGLNRVNCVCIKVSSFVRHALEVGADDSTDLHRRLRKEEGLGSYQAAIAQDHRQDHRQSSYGW
jgi:hypothetical protein